MPWDYDPFDLAIANEGQAYTSRVEISGMGDAHCSFPAPFRDGELEDLLVRGGVVRRDLEVRVGERDTIQEIGQRLFSAAFGGSVGRFWISCLRRARDSDRKLRLHLRLRSPELWDLPWEYLYDPDADFLALLHEVTIVRYLEIPQPVQHLRVDPPLRVLVAVALPRQCRRLEVEREWEMVRSAWESIVAPGCVELELLAGASTSRVRQALRRRPFHIFHFIGHGELDGARRKGVLLFEKGKGERDPVTGRELIRVLRRQPALRLVVLNACEGARAAREDPFTGVAQQLVHGQIPAVVAMQFRIADDAAITFSRHFYQSLAEGMPVDAAVSEARLELASQHFEVEWGNPVLCMHSPDGQIFTLPPAPRHPSEEVPRTLEGRYKKVRRWLIEAGLAVLVLAVGVAIMLNKRDRFPTEEPAPTPVKSTRSATSDPDCPSPPGLAMSFVRIEPGTFVMGSDEGVKDQQPAHRVTISKAFCLGRFEVTAAQWKKVMGKPSRLQSADLPVANVSWNDAQAFLAALNRFDPGARYRLATESEWEYAARAGTEGRHSFGNNPDDLSDYANCRSEAKYDGYEGLAPVGSFRPNPWGLYDMYGNVSEWVADWSGPYLSDPLSDPVGPSAGTKKVRRGGSFEYKVFCDSTYRTGSKPQTRNRAYGFRVVRDPVDFPLMR